MAIKDPSFSIGIEEEYLLVDRTTRDLVRDMPQALFDAAQQALQGQVAREFLKSQIEVGTSVHRTPRQAGAELADLRHTVARLAAEHGLAPLAASTHPFARWSTQEPTERARYQAIAKDLAGVGRRLLPALIAACAEAGYRQMIAYIDGANQPSIQLHEAYDFRQVGLLPNVGFKFGRWTDSILMQRALGPGSGAPPGDLPGH